MLRRYIRFQPSCKRQVHMASQEWRFGSSHGLYGIARTTQETETSRGSFLQHAKCCQVGRQYSSEDREAMRSDRAIQKGTETNQPYGRIPSLDNGHRRILFLRCFLKFTGTSNILKRMGHYHYWHNEQDCFTQSLRLDSETYQAHAEKIGRNHRAEFGHDE